MDHDLEHLKLGIKHTARIYGERKQYKEVPSIKQIEQETQTDLKHTEVTLCVESEFMEKFENFLDAMAPGKYIISNFNETRETLRTAIQMTKL